MAERHMTGIQWTHVPGYIGATWNPTTGCTRVSPGCDHCYAFTLHDQRYKANRDAAREGEPLGQGPHAPSVARAMGKPLPMAPQYDVPFSKVQVLGEERLTEPLRKRKPHAYFVDSMSDLFHEDVPDEAIDRVFAVMAAAPRHVFMILTKRPQRLRDYLSARDRDEAIGFAAMQMYEEGHATGAACGLIHGGFQSTHAATAQFHDGMPSWPLPNVWLGTSVEDQARAVERVHHLIKTPAAVRFLSCEPLLGPVDLVHVRRPLCDPFDALRGGYRDDGDRLYEREHPAIDWVIVGGESGAHARPFDLGWARSLVQQCQAAGVAAFVKQLGAKPYETHSEGDFCGSPHIETAAEDECDGRCRLLVRGADGIDRPLRNRHGSNPDEWPEDLRVRQFPAGHADWFSQIAPAEVPA